MTFKNSKYSTTSQDYVLRDQIILRISNYKLNTSIKLCLICNAGHNYYVKLISVLKVIWQVIRDSSHFLTEKKIKEF